MYRLIFFFPIALSQKRRIIIGVRLFIWGCQYVNSVYLGIFYPKFYTYQREVFKRDIIKKIIKQTESWNIIL